MAMPPPEVPRDLAEAWRSGQKPPWWLLVLCALLIVVTVGLAIAGW